MGRMTFEIGKTYTCANGEFVLVKHDLDYQNQFVGQQVGGEPVAPRISLVYERDGRPSGTGFAEWTIIKELTFGVSPKHAKLLGIDGDEKAGNFTMSAHGPREIHEPEYDVAALGPKKVHENVTDRLDRLQREMEEGRRGLIYRLDLLDKRSSDTNGRLAKMDEAHALDVVATDARLGRLSGIIDEVDGKFDKRCTNLGHKADGAHTRIKAVSDALAGTDHEGENVKRRLEKLEKLPGLATLNAAVVKLEDRVEAIEAAALRKAVEASVTPRTIKGGWVNVYAEDEDGNPFEDTFFSPHPTKEAADKGASANRIACIQIPDLTEGDGL